MAENQGYFRGPVNVALQRDKWVAPLRQSCNGDVSGVVEKCGAQATTFKVGDEVFGMVGIRGTRSGSRRVTSLRGTRGTSSGSAVIIGWHLTSHAAALTLAPKPIEPDRLRAEMIFSRPCEVAIDRVITRDLRGGGRLTS